MEALDLHFFQKKGGRRYGARDSVFADGAECAERRAGEAVFVVLHVVVERRVVSNSLRLASRWPPIRSNQ